MSSGRVLTVQPGNGSTLDLRILIVTNSDNCTRPYGCVIFI
jgi:hypothetical protein